METCKLTGAEFKTLIIKMLSELRGRVDEHGENFNKGIGTIKMEIENKKRTSQK